MKEFRDLRDNISHIMYNRSPRRRDKRKNTRKKYLIK